MKKLIAIPLLVLYFTAVSGMMVQFHFCGNKLSSWKVNEQSAVCCCGDDVMPVAANGKVSLDEESCCSDKVVTLKIAQDQNTAHSALLQLSALQVAVLPVFAVPQLAAVPEAPQTVAYSANAPPGLWQNIPLFKLHSCFTYYG
jgi:hypothetical protein